MKLLSFSIDAFLSILLLLLLLLIYVSSLSSSKLDKKSLININFLKKN